jgi:hypothetical protein
MPAEVLCNPWKLWSYVAERGSGGRFHVTCSCKIFGEESCSVCFDAPYSERWFGNKNLYIGLLSLFYFIPHLFSECICRGIAE